MGEGTDLSFEETRVWLSRMRNELCEHEAQLDSNPAPGTQPEVRLRLGEVIVTVERTGLKAVVTLCHQDTRYRGVCEDRGARKHGWLVAEATVGALNSFLSTCTDAARSIELVSAGDMRLPSGDAAAVATVEFLHRGAKERLLGAVLASSRPLEAQAAAVLDAVNRRLSRSML